MGIGTDETGQVEAHAKKSGLIGQLKHPGSTYREGVGTRLVKIEPKSFLEAKLTSNGEMFF
jgi:hypothetical protein